MMEILFVVLLIGGMLGTSFITKQWWLFRVFLIFFICFGLVEWWAVATTNLSVSQHFWEFSKNNVFGGWIVIIGMFLSWIALLWHLGRNLWKRK